MVPHGGTPLQIGETSFGLAAVSCPTTTFCAAVGSLGKTYIYNGATWATKAIGANSYFTSVSCSSSSFCLGVSHPHLYQFATFNGTAWSTISSVPLDRTVSEIWPLCRSRGWVS